MVDSWAFSWGLGKVCGIRMKQRLVLSLLTFFEYPSILTAAKVHEKN